MLHHAISLVSLRPRVPVRAHATVKVIKPNIRPSRANVLPIINVHSIRPPVISLNQIIPKLKINLNRAKSSHQHPDNRFKPSRRSFTNLTRSKVIVKRQYSTDQTVIAIDSDKDELIKEMMFYIFCVVFILCYFIRLNSDYYGSYVKDGVLVTVPKRLIRDGQVKFKD
jgi:hypothetical protein